MEFTVVVRGKPLLSMKASRHIVKSAIWSYNSR